jgi:uncharacterized membrane protein
VNDLLVAAIVFVGTHVGISSTPVREQLVTSLGEGRYRLLYSVVAAVTLIWLGFAYSRAPTMPIWEVGIVGRALAIGLMPFAFLFVVCALTGPNPTAVGQSPDADAPEPARGILRITRHPLLWGIGLWAILHLLANGDLASFILFGALATLALGGSFLIDAKRTQENRPGWGVFLQRTSNLPFAAILQRRQRLALREIGATQLLGALGAWVAFLLLHRPIFGVSPWG